MLYQQLICFLLIGILFNLLLNLRALRKAKADGELPEAPPLISVLIPARNEEANIGTCLESLRRQDYPTFEILVLDDASTDGTADVVAAVAAEDQRVRLLRGQPLPSGWAGKPFACQQLANEAQGSWLLFTDADTVHAPAVLRQVLCAALGSGAALISGFPHQRTTSVWQKMAIPIMFYFIILCWMPLWWMQRSRRTLPSVTIGQFMFFSAQEYRSIGGHEAVKSRILEDVWLGREVARHHYRQLTLDLSPLVSCQMYREFGTMWDGINRWFYVAASAPVSSALPMVGSWFAASAACLRLAGAGYAPGSYFVSGAVSGGPPLLSVQVVRHSASHRHEFPAADLLLCQLPVSEGRWRQVEGASVRF